jgi:hypothetical protein
MTRAGEGEERFCFADMSQEESGFQTRRVNRIGDRAAMLI